jgi:hypothetical protein
MRRKGFYMLDFGKEIEELKKKAQKVEKENEIILKGVGEDAGLRYIVNDDIASQIKALLDGVAQPRLWVSGDGRKTAKKMAEKIESTDGVFEYRPVDTSFGVMYQIRIVPRAKGTTLESQYASTMTQRIKSLSGIMEFVYTAKNGRTYKGRGFKDEETAKEMVDHLNNNINL